MNTVVLQATPTSNTFLENICKHYYWKLLSKQTLNEFQQFRDNVICKPKKTLKNNAQRKRTCHPSKMNVRTRNAESQQTEEHDIEIELRIINATKGSSSKLSTPTAGQCSLPFLSSQYQKTLKAPTMTNHKLDYNSMVDHKSNDLAQEAEMMDIKRESLLPRQKNKNIKSYNPDKGVGSLHRNHLYHDVDHNHNNNDHDSSVDAGIDSVNDFNFYNGGYKSKDSHGINHQNHNIQQIQSIPFPGKAPSMVPMTMMMTNPSLSFHNTQQYTSSHPSPYMQPFMFIPPQSTYFPNAMNSVPSFPQQPSQYKPLVPSTEHVSPLFAGHHNHRAHLRQSKKTSPDSFHKKSTNSVLIQDVDDLGC